MKHTFYKIAITAGGGGHFAPVLSLLQALPKEADVLCVGRKYALEGDSAVSLEYQTSQSLGIPFHTIITGRVQRKFTWYTFTSLLKIPLGFIQAYLLLLKFRPDVVLSFGGYVSVPVCIVAYILRIPIVIHEQTLEAGLANKIVSIIAKKICISWESSKSFFPQNKIVYTGIPIREEIIHKYPISNFQFQISNEKLPIIYITGGSLGAHVINVLVEGCIEKLLKSCKVIHQTGDARKYKDFERLSQKREKMNETLKNRYFITKFVDPKEVGAILRSATLVVSRCGINTVSELIYLGVPSLLIPLPISQNNEQLKNALFLKNTGCGEVARQDELSSEDLYNRIMSMIDRIHVYKKSVERVKQLMPADASKRIIQAAESLL